MVKSNLNPLDYASLQSKRYLKLRDLVSPTAPTTWVTIPPLDPQGAYMKILESSQTLLHVLKRETVNLTKHRPQRGCRWSRWCGWPLLWIVVGETSIVAKLVEWLETNLQKHKMKRVSKWGGSNTKHIDISPDVYMIKTILMRHLFFGMHIESHPSRAGPASCQLTTG